MDTVNKLIFLPNILKPIGKGIIVRRTDQYTKRTHGSGKSRIILPQGKDHEVERKFDVGEVLAVGADVIEVGVGDIILYQISTAFRVPNGIEDPICWKVEEFAMSVIAILPNLDKAKRTEKWKDIDETDLEKYHKMLEDLPEDEKAANFSPNLPPSAKIPAVTLGTID